MRLMAGRWVWPERRRTARREGDKRRGGVPLLAIHGSQSQRTIWTRPKSGDGSGLLLGPIRAGTRHDLPVENCPRIDPEFPAVGGVFYLNGLVPGESIVKRRGPLLWIDT